MSLTQARPSSMIDTTPPLIVQELLSQRVLNIGVIGYGYWGPKIVRNFQEIPTTRIAMVADLNPARLAAAYQAAPRCSVTHDYIELLESDVDAVIVATPISTHFRIAKDCLRYGKHVLIEKPLARSREEGQQLIDLAEERGRVLMVGHTFEYNPAVEMLREIVASGEIGRVYYAYTSRTNLGIFQRDINVLWDLAPHDLSILLYVLGQEPINVSACGQACVQPGIHDVARMTVNFADCVQAYIHVSWLDPCKIRRITIVGDRKMVVYDDVEMLEKIRIYDKGVEQPDYTNSYGEFQLSYRSGSITIPCVAPTEPLKVECEHFAECIMNGTRPRSDGRVGLKVVKILESAERSLLNGGICEPINW